MARSTGGSGLQGLHRPGADALSVVRARLGGEYRLQLEVCAGLEEFAEQLPQAVNDLLAHTLQGIIEPSWTEHVGLQRGLVFPLLRRHHSGNMRILGRIDRFDDEHERLARLTRSVALGLLRLPLAEASALAATQRSVRTLLTLRRRHILDEQGFIEAVLPTAVSVAERVHIGALMAEHALPRLKREPRRLG